MKMCDNIYANAAVTTDQRFNSKNDENFHDDIHINEDELQTGSTRSDRNKKNSGGETAGSRLYKGIIGGLVLLCVLLLAIIIVLAVKRDQLQTSYKNLAIEKDQLQNENDKCQSEVSYIEQRCTYFNSSVYNITTERKTWSGSRQDCTQRGADLVMITSVEEQNFISRCFPNTPAWIGLNDITTEGTFMWVDGTALNTGFWKDGEPNSYGGNEDCVVTGYTSSHLKSWNDFDCGNSVVGICEKRL